MPRRKCLDLADDECGALRPPTADFPNWSSTLTHYSDLLNLDIKVPGEHTIRGETFHAEIQMLHLHLEAGRMGYIGVPIRAQHGGFNQEYQDLLDHFQTVYDEDLAACNNTGSRRLRAAGDSLRSNFNNITKKVPQRLLQSGKSFDPYTDFMKTVFFYRYHGSSTEPPCFPITWFVMTTPLIIDVAQLRHTRTLLLTHVVVDAAPHQHHCRKTSVHNAEQSVVRPIQPLGIVPPVNKRREVMLCQGGDFLPDPQ